MPSTIPGIFLGFFFLDQCLFRDTKLWRSKGKKLYKVKICNVGNYISLQPSKSILQAGQSWQHSSLSTTLSTARSPKDTGALLSSKPQCGDIPKGHVCCLHNRCAQKHMGCLPRRLWRDSYAQLLLIEGTVCSPRLSSPLPKAFTLWGD